MFGLGNKQEAHNDKLTVQVHVVGSSEAFQMAQQIWAANVRLLSADPTSGKEYLHFAYASPKCVVWLQHDQGRSDTFELIVRWEESGQHEVYVLTAAQSETANDARAKELLHQVLTIPSIVPSGASGNKVQ